LPPLQLPQLRLSPDLQTDEGTLHWVSQPEQSALHFSVPLLHGPQGDVLPMVQAQFVSDPDVSAGSFWSRVGGVASLGGS